MLAGSLGWARAASPAAALVTSFIDDGTVAPTSAETGFGKGRNSGTPVITADVTVNLAVSPTDLGSPFVPGQAGSTLYLVPIEGVCGQRSASRHSTSRPSPI